jgi:hypothetical protein
MINRQALLADLQKFLQRIESDLLERSESTEVPEVPAALHVEYEKAAKAERTAQNYEDWRTDTITQAAAAWVLSCVFVRFLEDNSLIDPPKIAGPGDRLTRARDEHELYFRSHPQHTDREYLRSIFDELAKLPGTKDIFGEHNAINDLPNWLSGDAAGELLNFFQKIDASTGDLVHDFTDPNWDTRFLGDLYQDLSEAARKKFALLQTPDFVEEFILDRTLDPAIEEFGLVPQPSASDPQSPVWFKMIDPACGSGHFLLGAFPRLLDRWQRKEPGTNIRELTQRALNSIHGVDINPFAVAIAKFRLLLAAMKACGVQLLSASPAFTFNIACGDSLYHGRQKQLMLDGVETDESHYFASEDTVELKRILNEGVFHAVVANPPYITAKDTAANSTYRKLYKYCHGQFQLVVPFLERIFSLSHSSCFGYVGVIVGNAFARADFGKKIVENGFPKWNVTHVIDTSGVYIPGHGNPDGTPTLILFGRSHPPRSENLRTLISIRTEKTRPEILSQGKAWIEVQQGVDGLFEGHFIKSLDVERSKFHRQPWPITGDDEADLIETLQSRSQTSLSDSILEIGRSTHTGEDDAFCLTRADALRASLSKASVMLVEGKDVRNFVVTSNQWSLVPYDASTGEARELLAGSEFRHYWVIRQVLKNRLDYGQTPEERGLRWYEQSMFFPRRYRESSYLCFAFTATHNHFALVDQRAVFKQTAPIVVLKEDTAPEFRKALHALLNCSITCFWMRQHGFPRGGFSEGKWQERFNFNNTCVESLPLPFDSISESTDFRSLANRLFLTARRLQSITEFFSVGFSQSHTKQEWVLAIQECASIQEEIDWECYKQFGLLSDSLTYSGSLPPLELGQRAFEIVLARKMAAGELQSTWFERHGSTPITDLPSNWADDYKKLVERRIELIENDPKVRLIEQPEYKRRWNTEPWESQLERAQSEWLLLRLETLFDFDGRMTDGTSASNRPVPLGEIAMYSVAQLADASRRDPQFMEVGEFFRDDPAFDVQALVEELVLAESVPHLPILRYKDSGLRKRDEWEKTWHLQRREDAGESVGTIPVPPKYTSADFISTGGARYWSLRGKLDVPKERWISFPHCEGPDGTLVICWAGYDHLQQAQAISAYYVRVQTEFGGSDDPRLIPLLASLIELLPWLKQWHNEPNANFDGLRMGDYFEGFVNEEARNLGKTLAEIKAWVPPKKVAKVPKAKKRETKNE